MRGQYFRNLHNIYYYFRTTILLLQYFNYYLFTHASRKGTFAILLFTIAIPVTYLFLPAQR